MHLPQHTAQDLTSLYGELLEAQSGTPAVAGTPDPRVKECGRKIRRILQDLGMTTHDIAHTARPGMTPEQFITALRAHLTSVPTPRRKKP